MLNFYILQKAEYSKEENAFQQVEAAQTILGAEM